MKLCRFSLHETPDVVRSGIFHDSRVYETQGDQARGIHDLSKITFYAPLGASPTLRLFDGTTYRYANSTQYVGPVGEIEVPSTGREMDLRIRLAYVAKDSGMSIGSEEAGDFILAISTLVEFFVRDEDGIAAMDMPVALGPFLVTLEELEGQTFPTASLKVNGEDVATANRDPFDPAALFVAASRSIAIQTADILAAPAFPLPPLAETNLGRALQPSDSLTVQIAPLPPLTLKIV